MGRGDGRGRAELGRGGTQKIGGGLSGGGKAQFGERYIRMGILGLDIRRCLGLLYVLRG